MAASWSSPWYVVLSGVVVVLQVRSTGSKKAASERRLPCDGGSLKRDEMKLVRPGPGDKEGAPVAEEGALEMSRLAVAVERKEEVVAEERGKKLSSLRARKDGCSLRDQDTI